MADGLTSLDQTSAGVTMMSLDEGSQQRETTQMNKSILVRDQEEESSSEDETIVKKRNPDTDSRNLNFLRLLKERSSSVIPDFKQKNVEYVHSLNTGRPLQQRIDVPDSVIIGQYGGQRNNIWEFQKSQLRYQIA